MVTRIQLALSAAWTPLFFAAGLYWVAFAEVCLLWATIAVTLAMFARRSRLTALPMVPYLLWAACAGALNLAIAIMN